MKNFKDLLSEVAQPKSAEEQRFKDLHKVELIKHPVAPEYVHTGEVEGLTKKARPADQSGDDSYDQAYEVKDKPFKMPRDIDEEVEQIEEATHDISESSVEGISFKNLLEKVIEDVEDFDDLISEEPEYVSEEPQQEIPMMMRQLHFIGYAADEIMEYLAMGEDPEEWYQNKLANAFSMMKTLHAYVEGDKRMGKNDLEAGYMMSSYYGEETEIEEATAHRVGKSFSAMSGAGAMERDYIVYVDGDTKNPLYKYSTSDEAKKKRDELKAQGKDADYKDVKKRSTLKYQGESVEVELEEANFKAGNMKLKDGSQVKISMDDARAITAVMKTLNPKNRKEMEARMMKDKKGFEEILDFAREAQ